jgi:hypothetical protein
MDIDWPLELLRLEATNIRHFGDHFAALSAGPGTPEDRRYNSAEAGNAVLAYTRLRADWHNRPVACVACDGTGTDPVWGYCLVCDGHKVTTRGLRATLQSVKALNLAVAASHHLVADRLRRELSAYHEAQDKRLGLDGHWDV